MAHFAQINSDDNIVIKVVTMDDAQCAANGGVDSDQCATWVDSTIPDDAWTADTYYDGNYPQNTYVKRCDKKTQNNEHADGGTPFRGNYPAQGYTYDSATDKFIPPKPYSSWVFNTSRCDWEPSFGFPARDHGEKAMNWTWDDENSRWVGQDFENTTSIVWSSTSTAWEIPS